MFTLGQEDLQDADLLAIQQAGLYLGLSTHSWFEIARAHSLRPSYVAIGPIYETTTKIMPWKPQGLVNLTQWNTLLSSTYPIVAIGGINNENAEQVLATQVGSIAMVRAITEAPDYVQAINELNEKITAASDGSVKMMNKISGLLQSLFKKPHAFTVLLVLAAILHLGASISGRMAADDYIHAALFSGSEALSEKGLTKSSLSSYLSGVIDQQFKFFDSDHTDFQAYKTFGGLPWWTAEKGKIHFFRPLATFSHYLDYKLWPR